MSKSSSKRNRSSKKHNFGLNYLLKSRNVLYIVLFFTIANLFSFLMLKQLDAIAFFIIIGFLTTYFTKNMIIVMLISMIVTFILVQVNLLGNIQEGMVEGNEHEDENNDEEEEEDEDEYEDEDVMKPPVEIPITSEQRESITKSKNGLENMPTNKKKYNEKYTSLTPSNYNESDSDTSPNNKPTIDYASTLETAYDSLDKILSSDAIKNMSADTGRLAKKQHELMGNIEKMTPIMKKASAVMEKVDLSMFDKLLGGKKE
jgi:hypothetical protein